jgi:hypothetical protein
MIGWKDLHGKRVLYIMGFLRVVTCAEFPGKPIVVFRRTKELALVKLCAKLTQIMEISIKIMTECLIENTVIS